MTNEEIFEKLGIANATDADKEACLHNIDLVVELRVMSMMNQLLSDDETDRIAEMEKNGSSKDDILWWLGENVASVHELMDATKRDYVDELANK